MYNGILVKTSKYITFKHTRVCFSSFNTHIQFTQKMSNKKNLILFYISTDDILHKMQ